MADGDNKEGYKISLDEQRRIAGLTGRQRDEQEFGPLTDAEAQLFAAIDESVGTDSDRVSAESERVSQINLIRELNNLESLPSDEREPDWQERRDWLIAQLEDSVRAERERERYLDTSLRLFTRLDTQKENALETIRGFAGLRPNRNEILGPLNDFADKIESLRKDGDEGSEQRRAGELKAAALEFELKKARLEVTEAIDSYNPVVPLRLKALRELEISEDERVPLNNAQIRELLKILDDPELNRLYGKQAEAFRDEYNALVRIHNFAVAGKGKGAVEITTALGELDQKALVELFGGQQTTVRIKIGENADGSVLTEERTVPLGEAVRMATVDVYEADRRKFAELSALNLGQKEAEMRLEEETFLGNKKRTFKARREVDPSGVVTIVDDIEQAYRNATTEEEKNRLLTENSDLLAEGYKAKKDLEKRYVDDILDSDFLSPEKIAEFRTQNQRGGEVTDEQIKSEIRASYDFQSRRIELSQKLDNVTGFMETTVAPIMIAPISVVASEPLKNGETHTYVFAGKFKDNPLVKQRYPQDVVEAGGKVNSKILDVMDPIFSDGFYKYPDPGVKMMTEIFKINNESGTTEEWLIKFRDLDVLSKIRENPEVVNNLKDDVYKDAAAAQAAELYDKFETFQRDPNEEAAKVLMSAYFGKNPEDRRKFNMQVIEALARYRMRINGIFSYSDNKERQNWGPSRIVDYIRKAREATLIGEAEEKALIKKLFGGRLIKNGKLRLEMIGKPAEFGKAWAQEVIGWDKNDKSKLLKHWGGFGVNLFKTIFNQSKAQIKQDL